MPPQNWDWSYKTIRGMKIRYGLPRSPKIYKAVMVIFGGLGDYGEQYFEFVHECETQDIKVIIIDLPGQGGSGRYLPHAPHKRHSAGFTELLEDLHVLVDEIALSAAIDADDNHKRLPLILFGHSLGGHIALRYLKEYNKASRGYNIFSAAIFSAPLFGIKAVEMTPPWLRNIVFTIMRFKPTAYVPGGCDWYDGFRERPGFKGIFTSDPVRNALQSAYFLNPTTQHLAIGSPTNKWLLDAVKSCRHVNKSGYLDELSMPLLVGLASEDQLVDNAATRKLLANLPQADLFEIKGAQHELLLEADIFRQIFVDRIFTFIRENVLNRPDAGKTHIL
ncbi:MAG: alpha/beta fold hydrolase [Pseudobdellovibrionaceae bacterium]